MPHRSIYCSSSSGRAGTSPQPLPHTSPPPLSHTPPPPLPQPQQLHPLLPRWARKAVPTTTAESCAGRQWRSSSSQRQIGASRLTGADRTVVTGIAERSCHGGWAAVRTGSCHYHQPPPRLSVSISARPRARLVSSEVTLHNHRSAASALRFAPSGIVLASDSKDLWDVVAQAGLFRPCGHRGQATDFLFLDSDKKLVTCSKDKVIRVWDLDRQHCLLIVGGHHNKIWSMDVDSSEKFWCLARPIKSCGCSKLGNQLKSPGEDCNKWDALRPQAPQDIIFCCG